ncbi:segregation and condensation protein A [Thalassotalea euphylliae]|uniref:segregation and condensation protein A n=1 Tax=Thalassotalea euphylliae TaxID=1655234 RepID=UPI0036447134
MEQQELPFARVRGEAFTEKPGDLYIPEGALTVRLDEFEGPLDLLLYLIKKQKFDIADLPIAPISQQYSQYLEHFEQYDIDLSSDYLVMAATLMQIKSKLLLPVTEIEEDEEDPRAELIRKLQEYQRIKKGAELLDELPRQERDFFVSNVDVLLDEQSHQHENVALGDLVKAFQQVLAKQTFVEHHHIQREVLSTHDKMDWLLATLKEADTLLSLPKLLVKEEGRAGVVVTFIAILELLKHGEVDYLVENDMLWVKVI